MDTGQLNSTPRKLKFEQLRADYELFLQTFEKPTWIYRLLQRRQQISPFMLHRNLSYLREPKKNKIKPTQQEKRSKFKIDDILAKKTEIPEIKQEDESDSTHYMNMSFGGFFHGPGYAEDIFHTSDPKVQEIFKDDFVNVDIHLVHVYHRRKKDKQQPLDVIQLGECQAPWNPRTQLLLPCTSVQISVPPTAFADNGRSIKTHIIAITVSILVPKKVKKKKGGGGRKKKIDDTPNKADTSINEPPAKKVKSEEPDYPTTTNTDSKIEDVKVETGKDNKENKTKKGKGRGQGKTPKKTQNKEKEKETKNNKEKDEETSNLEDSPVETVTATFSAELIVYDKHKNCLLTNGDYELLVQENVDTTEYGKNNSWENKFKSKLGPFAAFSFGPTIKFSLSWETKPTVPCKTVYRSLSDPYVNNTQPIANGVANGDGNHDGDEETNGDNQDTAPRVFYQFIYNNATRQQTEAREGTSCPWCAVKTKRLYGLLKHLKCCHGRFAFLYTPLKSGHRIDVCINENFESTLTYDGVKDIGFICVDNAPMRRTPASDLLVTRPYKYKEDFSEFTEPDTEDVDGVTPIKGHERVYYHTRNNQKMSNLLEYNPNDEDDRAPDWLIDKTLEMLEEFTDVNEGEKMLMKLWNIHVLKQGYISDHTIAISCKTFIEEHGVEIVKKNLVRNFLIHLNNLIEFQVIPQSAIVQAMQCLYEIRDSLKPATLVPTQTLPAPAIASS